MFPTIPLSLALADLDLPIPPGSDPLRPHATFAARAGFRAVHLNAAAPGLRPRDLDRSARRDLAAFLRRTELASSGADLWIPPAHFADPAQADRAVSATLAAIEFVADIDRLVRGMTATGTDGRILCVAFPAEIQESLLLTIGERAASCSVRVADFGAAAISHTLPESIGPGFDPAPVLLASPGASLPTAAGMLKLPGGLACARLSDANSMGRVAPGAPGGRLDLLSYSIGLTTAGYRAHVVLDVRGLPDQPAAAGDALNAWNTLVPA